MSLVSAAGTHDCFVRGLQVKISYYLDHQAILRLFDAPEGPGRPGHEAMRTRTLHPVKLQMFWRSPRDDTLVRNS